MPKKKAVAKRQEPAHREATSADSKNKTPLWTEWVAEWEAYVGHPICGCWSRREKRPCIRPPLKTRPTCRTHGSAAPRGSDHYNFKNGQWVGERDKRRARTLGILPPNLEKAFSQAMVDPELFNQDTWVSLSISRIDELRETLVRSESLEDQWAAIRKILKEARDQQYQRGGDEDNEPVDWEAVASDIEHVVEGHSEVVKTWELINEQQELIRRHTETETKRMKELKNAIPREAAILFGMAVRAAVAEEVRWQAGMSSPEQAQEVALILDGIRTRVESRVIDVMRNQLGHYLIGG